MKFTKRVVGLFALSLTCIGFNAMGIQITFAEYGVGYWVDSQKFNSDGLIDNGVQRSVDVWNGDAPAGFWNADIAPGSNDKATFTKGGGSTLPPVLPDVIAYVSRDESSPYQVDNTAGLYTYITAKYGSEQQWVFYVASVHDIITVPNNAPGLGDNSLSHLAWLTAERVPQVPDGGATAMLLGVGLAGLAAVRRSLGI